MNNTQIEKLKRTQVSINDIEEAFNNDMSEDGINIFIKFKDDIEVTNIITGISEFSISIDDEDIFFNSGEGLCLNNKRSIVDPVQLLEDLKPYIDFCFT